MGVDRAEAVGGSRWLNGRPAVERRDVPGTPRGMSYEAALVLGPLITWIVTNRFDEILNALAKSAG